MILLLVGCAGGDALPLGSTAADCASCHVEEAAAWSSSGHGTSGESPVLKALRPLVEEAWGEVAAQACDDCHQPGWGGDTSIGCVSCHAATGNHGVRDGRLVVDLGQPLAGPLGGGSVATPAHTSTVRGYLRDSDLCGTCHEVTGPRLFVERTRTEHDDAGGDGAPACVDCHARRIEDGGWTPDTPSRERHDHRFVGLSPPWDADDATIEAYAVASGELLGSGLELRVEGREVVVTNVGAGHTIPTGVTFLRSIRVEVEQRGEVVETLLELGADTLLRGEPAALVTDADEVRSNGLEPGESRRAPLPAGAGVVHLRARAFREEVEEALGVEAGGGPHTIATVAF